MDIRRYPSVLEEVDGIPIPSAPWVDMRWSSGLPPLPAADWPTSLSGWLPCACDCGCHVRTPNVVCRWCTVAGVHRPEGEP